jgi:hypothetical protein
MAFHNSWALFEHGKERSVSLRLGIALVEERNSDLQAGSCSM